MAATGGARYVPGWRPLGPQVNHAEGRVAPIADVQRRLGSSGGGPVTAARAVLATWHAGEDTPRD